MTRQYKRSSDGKFSSTGGGGGSKKKDKKKPKPPSKKDAKKGGKKKPKKKQERVPVIARDERRAFGNTSKSADVRLKQVGTRKRKRPSRKVVKKVGAKPSKGTKKDRRLKRNKKKK